MFFFLALAIGATVLGGCGGGGSGNYKSSDFTASANADPFAGPSPLAVRFTSSAKLPVGKVRYYWRFDDGTSSNAQNPAHTFPHPGYYIITLDIFDQSGNRARQSLMLGAWGAREWATSQRVPLTKARAIHAQKEQQARTKKRERKLGEQLRKEIAGAVE